MREIHMISGAVRKTSGTHARSGPDLFRQQRDEQMLNRLFEPFERERRTAVIFGDDVFGDVTLRSVGLSDKEVDERLVWLETDGESLANRKESENTTLQAVFSTLRGGSTLTRRCCCTAQKSWNRSACLLFDAEYGREPDMKLTFQ